MMVKWEHFIVECGLDFVQVGHPVILLRDTAYSKGKPDNTPIYASGGDVQEKRLGHLKFPAEYYESEF